MKINGKEYAIPDGETLKLAEWQIVERYCDGHLNEDGYEISKVMGMIHIGIKRAEPTVPDDEIREVVEKLEMGDLAQLDEAGQSPPAPGSNGSSATTASAGSPASGNSPEQTRKASGAPPSATAAISGRETSAA